MPIGLNNDNNNLGILNGNINSDFRNVVQNITNLSTGQNDGTNTRLYNTTQYLQSATNQYRIVCQGIIVPKYTNSLIEVITNMAIYNDNTVTTQVISYLYIHSTTQGAIGTNLTSTPSGTLIGTTGSDASIGSTGVGGGQQPGVFYINNLTSNTTYYLTLFARSGNGSTGYVNIGNAGHTSMNIKEII